jgi:uncharacterized membrane protein
MGASTVTALGVILLWLEHKSDRLSYSTRTLVASLLFGIGTFNFIEGLIDHHLLGIHHVKAGPNRIVWDLGFLALNIVIAALGLFLLRKEPKTSETDLG